MKKIVAVNASPRTGWNTAALVREAARGAEEQGARVQVIDLYALEPFTGCVSCFGCKTGPNRGRCVRRDGLAPVLEAISEADGLILGTPNYLGDATAGFRALYERLVFRSLTYQKELPCCSERRVPVMLIMTSNAAEEMYPRIGYSEMLQRYQNTLGTFVGPVKVMISGDTLQVADYSRYNWTMFDPAAKQARHGAVFPLDREKACQMGALLAGNGWT